MRTSGWGYVWTAADPELLVATLKSPNDIPPSYQIPRKSQYGVYNVHSDAAIDKPNANNVGIPDVHNDEAAEVGGGSRLVQVTTVLALLATHQANVVAFDTRQAAVVLKDVGVVLLPQQSATSVTLLGTVQL